MNHKYSGSMGAQRLIKAMKSAGNSGGGGASLTTNSIDTTHISNGSITSDDLAPSLLNRIKILEQTAVLRSFDTLVGSPTAVSNFTIPVDLVNNESVEIDLNIKVFGTNLVHLKVGINGSGLTNQPFDEYNGIIREGSNITTNTPFNMATYGSGTVVVNVETQGLTSVIRMKLYRTHSLNNNFSRFQFESKAVYCRAAVGIATVETIGMTNDQLPTGLYIYLPNSNTTMTASYSIINDPRRTVLDGTFT
jgi:hypothetical protein